MQFVIDVYMHDPCSFRTWMSRGVACTTVQYTTRIKHTSHMCTWLGLVRPRLLLADLAPEMADVSPRADRSDTMSDSCRGLGGGRLFQSSCLQSKATNHGGEGYARPDADIQGEHQAAPRSGNAEALIHTMTSAAKYIYHRQSHTPPALWCTINAPTFICMSRSMSMR